MEYREEEQERNICAHFDTKCSNNNPYSKKPTLNSSLKQFLLLPFVVATWP